MPRWLSVLVLLAVGSPCLAQPASAPIVYSTDLFHPHDDPDDHFDLATLFALEEFDIRGVILDLGGRQAEKPGSVPLRQMMRLTGREVPYALGLAEPLASADDTGLGQPAEYQGGVELLLRVLRESDEPVTVFQTGSLRDVAAAYNREPELMRAKVARLYINAGNGAADQGEWNVGLDREAFHRIVTSDLPVHWCPCFGEDGYATYWRFRHADLFGALSAEMLAFFSYALMPAPVAIDPAAAMDDGALLALLDPAWRDGLWASERNMWCTGPFLHAAGRDVCAMPEGGYAALPVGPAGGGGPAPARVFSFEPVRVSVDERGRVTWEPDETSRFRIFHVDSPEAYPAAMLDCLRGLLGELGRATVIAPAAPDVLPCVEPGSR